MARLSASRSRSGGTPAAPARRRWLGAGAAAGLGLGFGTLGPGTFAPLAGGALWAVAVRPARADAAQLEAALRAYTGGSAPTPGRVRMEIAPLVDNGNAVPLTVQVDSPMTEADHVTGIAVFNELNPQREVIAVTLAPALGVARLATRIRLATSQKLVAVARTSDGRHWSHTVDVIVTLAACLEG